jgi:glutaminase
MFVQPGRDNRPQRRTERRNVTNEPTPDPTNKSTDGLFVSTGSLPGAADVARLVAEAHARFRHVRDGSVSQVYPALAEADPTLFGIAVVGVTGEVARAGGAEVEFTTMSCAKPFVFALAAETVGVEQVRRRVGVNATGLPFNSAIAVERTPDGRTNPMVNAGAIVTTSLVSGDSAASRWTTILAGLSSFAGRPLVLDERTYESASATNQRNRALAMLVADAGGLAHDPVAVTDLYTRQSCLLVTAVDLATMGATLADGGVNPVTGERVVSADVARATLAVMAVAGLYESSGDWLLDVGLPGKSGIGGGIVTVSPGKGALGTFAPPLDAAGNSVRGCLVAAHLARKLGLDIFASAPA